MSTTTSRTIALAIAFEVIWFSLILTVQSEWFWLGPLLGLFAYIIILPHLQQARMAAPLTVVALLGFGFDMLMHHQGVIRLYSNDLSYIWLLVLWLVFVAMFYQLFYWLSNLNSFTSYLTGALGGVGSYYGASHLGAVEILNMPIFVGVYSLFWGISFALASKVVVARRLAAGGRHFSRETS